MTAACSYRHAVPADGPAIAQLFQRVRAAKLPYLPVLHTPADDLAFFGGHVMETCTVWVAETDRLVGFIAFRKDWVDHLYVDATHHGQGIGSALLMKAMASEPALELWAFQKNTEARRFYERKGFRVLKETDGRDNEEREPDLLLGWRRD
jgi:putative acetyltransferase